MSDLPHIILSVICTKTNPRKTPSFKTLKSTEELKFLISVHNALLSNVAGKHRVVVQFYTRRVEGKVTNVVLFSSLVPSNFGYLSEGSMLRLLFDFLVQAGKTGGLKLSANARKISNLYINHAEYANEATDKPK